MGIHHKPGFEDFAMLQELQRLANGYDQHGMPVDRQTQLYAIEKFQEITARKAQVKADQQRAEAEELRAAAYAEGERKRAETDAEVARRRVKVEEDRLKLEAVEMAERLQIEKAQVMVKALEVAVQGGLDADRLLTAIQDLGGALQLPGATSEALQLEKKDEG